jgi:ABC-type multidrug transport system fused ATPase/permease subunit
MIQTIKKIFFLLSENEKKKAIILIGMVLIMAILDMIGVASIMPFIAVLSNPELIETNKLINEGFQFVKSFGVSTTQEYIFILGVMVFIFLLLSLLIKALTIYLQLRFNLMCEYTISKRLLDNYLHQPYSWHLNRNSADLAKNILSEVTLVISGGLSSLSSLITQGAVVIAMIFLLILINPEIALFLGFFLGGTYGIIYKFSHFFLYRIGKERLKLNEIKFKTINDAFGALKELKLGELENIYIERFRNVARVYARHQASSQTIALMPRFALEALAFGGILLVTLYLMKSSGNFSSVAPIIALYAFAGYRLMPGLQTLYKSLTQIRFASPSIERLYNDLKNIKQPINPSTQNKISFNESLALKKINFYYHNSKRPTLKNINLLIPINTTVGIAGQTGSGKTTIINIILGLLEPNQGTLEIDGISLNKNNLRSWQRLIGYVPQQIYLIDDTIAANIAFGIDKKEIKKDDLVQASKIAKLHDFILDKLPLKYDTVVGEKGIRLSGGQIQRIGIARALYHKPKILIFDEATSSLDNITEKEVMNSIDELKNKITIVIIAHRLSTIKKCSKIFLFNEGEIIEQGSYDQIVKKNQHFREMSNLS